MLQSECVALVRELIGKLRTFEMKAQDRDG
jgi:hypothetical protein